MTLKTVPFDATDYLKDAESRAEYLTAAFETGDPAFIARSLGTVARAAGMSRLGGETGGNPELSTLIRVLSALGMRIRVEVDKPADRTA